MSAGLCDIDELAIIMDWIQIMSQIMSIAMLICTWGFIGYFMLKIPPSHGHSIKELEHHGVDLMTCESHSIDEAKCMMNEASVGGYYCWEWCRFRLFLHGLS